MTINFLENIDLVISGYFNNKNLTQKNAIFILGPPNSGKTKYINENIKNTHIIIDASIFYKKLNGSTEGFSKNLNEELNYIGVEILRKLLRKKISFVVEFQLDQYKYIMNIVKKLKLLDYKVSGLSLDITEKIALEREKKRDKENISSYFTENYHIAWFLESFKILGV